mgnify:CR=1 FL=1
MICSVSARKKRERWELGRGQDREKEKGENSRIHDDEFRHLFSKVSAQIGNVKRNFVQEIVKEIFNCGTNLLE